ncbi:MAG: ABC transporter substrate-binding protein [Candidatus Aminicenantes bacterium]
MKKLAGFFLFLILVSLWQCGGTEKGLTFWIGGTPEEANYWENLIQEFEDQTGLQVRLVRQPADSSQRRQGLVISLESLQPDPDVFLMDVIWVGQFVHSGWLEPLDDLIQKDRFPVDLFFPRILSLVDRYHHRLFALPVYVDSGVLYFRSDLLEKYGYSGPPETWSELVDISLRIQEAERRENPRFSGFVWQGAQYEGLVCTFLEFACSAGGGIWMEDSIQLDHPRNVRALRFMQNLIHGYQISPANTYTEMKEEEVRRAFQKGNALFERNWPYAWKLHQRKDSPVKGKVKLAALPSFKQGQTSSTLGGWHVGISRYSDVKERAWELVRFITSYSTQKNLALNLGWNPGRKDIYADREILKELPHFHKLRDVFNQAVARPNLPYYNQVSAVIQIYVNKCLAGKIKPAEALEQMQKQTEKITALYEE